MATIEDGIASALAGDPKIAAIESGGAYANQHPVDIAAARGHMHVVEYLRPIS